MSQVRMKNGRTDSAGMRSGWRVGRWMGRMVVCLALFVMAGQVSAQTVEYIHTDALGSPVAVTNAAGEVVERQVYEPYGTGVTRGPNDGPGFTGHVEDAATGLTYMQQRYYDSGSGLFLSQDPVSALNKQNSFNRYAYANGNPYRFLDPDGRSALVTRMKDGSIAVKIAVRFEGLKESDSVMVESFKKGVERTYSGTYSIGGKATKVTVSVVDATSSTPSKLTNIIKLTDGPTSIGPSFVTNNTRGGEWDRTSNSHREFEHEAGHLMGMEDRYDAWKDEAGVRRSQPQNGWEGNLMGELLPNATINSANMNEVMSGKRNVFEEE